MNWEMISGVVRHAATFLAGIMVSSGLFDAGQTEAIVGVLMGMAGLAWSIIAKKMGWGATTTATAIAFISGSAALVAANDNIAAIGLHLVA